MGSVAAMGVLIGMACAVQALASADPDANLMPTNHVCDTSLETPIGVLADFTVGHDGTVYLLDAQQFVVHVLGPDGMVRSPIGAHGEGPGELFLPAIVAARSGERCVVLQAHHAPAVCLQTDGEICSPPRLELLREDWGDTVFQRAQALTNGDLVVSMTRGLPAARLRAGSHGPHHELVRLSADGETVEVLLSTVAERGQLGRLPSVVAGHFARYGWDLDSRDRLLYTDPVQPDSVHVVSLRTGHRSSYSIKIEDEAERAVRELERELGLGAGDLPLVASIAWLDEEQMQVLVQSFAAATDHIAEIGPDRFEVHDLLAGTRREVRIAPVADASVSLQTIRNGWMVIVEGGARARREHQVQLLRLIGDEEGIASDERPLSDAICVRWYELSELVASP